MAHALPPIGGGFRSEEKRKEAEKKLIESAENSKDNVKDFDYLFNAEESEKKKKGKGFVSKLFKMNVGKIILSVIMCIIKTSPAWVVPICTSNIIDIVTMGYNDNTIPSILLNALISLIFVVQNIPSHMFYMHVNDTLSRSINAGVKCSVVRKMQALSITYHKDMHTGRIQSKFLRDTDNVHMYVNAILNSLIPSIIGFVVATGIAIYKSGIVSLFFLAVVPINVIFVSLFRKPIRTANREFRVQNEIVSMKMMNMIEMIPVTKAHGLENQETSALKQYISGLTNAGLKVDKTNAGFGAGIWVISTITSFICLLFCAYLALTGKISVGEIVLYQSLFSSISSSVSGLIGVIPALSSGSEAVRSLTEIMSSKDVEMNLGKGDVTAIEGNVEFKNVSYMYPKTKDQTITDFSLSVKKGECIAVVGASGSGKSTLMNMIIGFLPPTEGDIFIDGESIKNINLTEYRHNISVVSQTSILFPGSIKDNITYGLTHYDNERLERVIDDANIREFLGELPSGIDSEVGERGEKLSGGQRQRVTIARALLRDPKILILDEATSALDNISEYHVQKAISSCIQGRTTFIVAHRLSTIRNADRIVVLDGGRIAEIGSYDELMAKKGKFYELKKLNDLNSKTAQEGLEA